MFRRTSQQSSLFEVESCVPHALPKDDWCFTYRRRVLPLIEEEEFRHLYCESEGRPNASVRTMISLLIFMGLERLTWRAAEFQFPRRLDWLAATETPIGQARIDHTTLFKFYGRLERDEVAGRLFRTFTEAFGQACGTSVVKQRTDSFFVHGWLRLLSRYGLFKETVRKFVRALRKQKPGLYEVIKKDLSQDYLEKHFDFTEKDKDLTHKKIALMARDLYRLQCAFENHKQVKHYETFKILSRVFSQQCEVKDRPEGDPEIVIKEVPDIDAVCTPHNPEARYVRKRKQRVTGDKAVVTETCDQDNKVQLITDVGLVDSTTPDCKIQGDVEDRLIKNGFKPDKQYEDAGFVTGRTILDAQEKGIALEGPSCGRSQDFETYRKTDRPLDAADFDIHFDADKDELRVMACPDGQAPKGQKRSEKTGDLIVHFDPDICRGCPIADRCSVKIGKRVASFRVDEANYVGALRHHRYMEDKAYRDECAIRSGAEATVSEITRTHGMRKSRHRKQARTWLQLIFAAIACNVKRFIRYGQNYAYLEAKLA